ncbi:DNA repair protein RecO [Aliikangiella marina]|uniref:DNA repair protein RecO n=1 Tax=Aliikangiella marina TaxID=1712262 RepID=A0A545TDS8_9GAMM|nr:DNA repair protein RecO [Aliikangiella marina]TQV75378.1 DNA repair protein RecO [Aliikangiella marina]
MNSKNERVKAIILHAKPYQESSMILQVFSFEYGLFSVIAKGIKGKKSQAKKALLQPFQILTLEITGRSNLKTLVGCELEFNEAINASLFRDRKLACAFYANEVLIRALPERHEFPDLFKAYCQLLANIANTENYSASLRQFELVLLRAIGVAPDFNFDIEGMPILADNSYILSVQGGFSKATKIELNDSFPGSVILSLGEGLITESHLKQSEQICRRLMRSVIGDKPLQSRKLWQHSNLT